MSVLGMTIYSHFFRHYDTLRQTNDANLYNDDADDDRHDETSSLLSLPRSKERDESSDDEARLRRQYVATNLQRLKRIVRNRVRDSTRKDGVRIQGASKSNITSTWLTNWGQGLIANGGLL